MRPLLTRFGFRCTHHEWGGWWIDPETGIASRRCVWCPAQQFEQLAHHQEIK